MMKLKELLNLLTKLLVIFGVLTITHDMTEWTPRLAQKWMNLTWGERIFKCKDTGEEVLIFGDMIYEALLFLLVMELLTLGA